MPTIVNFTGNGISFAKKRKVMPGTNHDFKPEIEQANWFYINKLADTDRQNYVPAVIAPTSEASVPSGVPLGFRCWDFIPLRMPIIDYGEESTRKGVRVLYRYARFKGFIRVTNMLSTTTRWRIVMYRLQDLSIVNPTDFAVNYPKFYNNVSTASMFSSNMDEMQGAWANNFHSKVWRVDTNNWAKHKVIASGVIPRTLSTSSLHFAGTNGDTEVILNGGSHNTANNDSEQALLIPLDIKVNLDDNIDFTVSYFLTIETDNPCSALWSSALQGLGRTALFNNAAISFYFFARLYYQDY